MKKKQLNRKLSLNKQTLSELDAKGMSQIKGGLAVKTETETCSCSCESACHRTCDCV
ncbi:class I lanthipeptide [Hymenobacter aquaticus]|uniref:class I lanthipeptide n=1 Tax=Hymenobacter aquaticus TaxID=1867101 RepID=UPI001AEC6964